MLALELLICVSSSFELSKLVLQWECLSDVQSYVFLGKLAF